MLRKLYKHEFYSLFRNLLPVYIGILALAVLSRFSMLFESKNNRFFEIFQGISTTLYVISIIAVFFFGVVLIVMRFYKNLLSHEGYLTFTLPFSATKHLVCKLVCGITVMIINAIVVIISLLVVILSPDMVNELKILFNTIWRDIAPYISTSQIVLLSIEIVFLVIVSMTTALLMFYVSMSIGQQFKNRIAASIVSYICIYAALQTISMVVVMPALILNTSSINNFFVSNPITGMFVFIAIEIVYQIALGTAYFLVTRHMLTKRLNLE